MPADTLAQYKSGLERCASEIGNYLSESQVSNPGNSEVTSGTPPDWKLSLWCYKNVVGIRFKTLEDIEQAIDLLWREPLKGCPYELGDGSTLIVPEEAKEYLKDLQYEEFVPNHER